MRLSIMLSFAVTAGAANSKSKYMQRGNGADAYMYWSPAGKDCPSESYPFESSLGIGFNDATYKYLGGKPSSTKTESIWANLQLVTCDSKLGKATRSYFYGYSDTTGNDGVVNGNLKDASLLTTLDALVTKEDCDIEYDSEWDYYYLDNCEVVAQQDLPVTVDADWSGVGTISTGHGMGSYSGQGYRYRYNYSGWYRDATVSVTMTIDGKMVTIPTTFDSYANLYKAKSGSMEFSG
jgi:hypothetical protein